MRSIIVACCIVPLLTHAVQAQTLVPSGTGLSVALTGVIGVTNVDLPGKHDKVGFSPRAEIGFATSPRLSVLGAWHRRQLQLDRVPLEIGSLELGVRYTGRPGTTLRPFAEAGMARRNFAYGSESVITAIKLGPWIGLGTQWRPVRHWSAEAALDFGAVDFDRFRVDGIARELQPVSARLTGVRLGGRYWLNAR